VRSAALLEKGGAAALHEVYWGERRPRQDLVLQPLCLRCCRSVRMCVAAYLALATGLEISIGAAAWLRVVVIAVCVLALVLVALRTIRPRLVAR
jgi:hypothetical protein